MAADIIPIELGLTAGNGLTLWAPTWREDGEDWEAFLGHGDELYVFPTTAHLAAFIRTCDRTRPARPSGMGNRGRAAGRRADARTTTTASTSSACPTWSPSRPTSGRWPRWTDTIGDPAVAGRGLRARRDRRGARFRRRLRPAARSVSRRSPGATVRSSGTRSVLVVVDRWDEVVDALDAIVTTPEVDDEALEIGLAEAAAISAAEKRPEETARRPGATDEAEDPNSTRIGTRTCDSGTRPASTAWRSPSAAASDTRCAATSARTRSSWPTAGGSRSTPRRKTWRTT